MFKEFGVNSIYKYDSTALRPRVERVMGTTLASSALTAQHEENGPAPLLSQGDHRCC